MSEERFDRLEKMMEQLMTMVGNNNAIAEELRQRMDGLDVKIDTLDAKLEQYGKVQQEDIYSTLKIINEKMDDQAEIHKLLSNRSIEQEAELSALKRKIKAVMEQAV